MKQELSDHTHLHINGEHTFFLNQKILSRYSGKLKKMIREESNKSSTGTGLGFEIQDFPGGSEAFELVSRFCYNNGRIHITPSNISTLYCSANFLEMTEEVSPCNLAHQTETFLDGLFYWSWTDILVALKSCEDYCFFSSSGGLLVDKLVSSLLSKIAQNSDLNQTLFSSSSSPSSASPSPSSSAKATPDSAKPWWFDDLTILSPIIIEKVVTTIGCYGPDNNNYILTKFLIHYLKRAGTKLRGNTADYSGLADTATHGVVLMGEPSFSCRALFWVLRVVSGLGVSRQCRAELEKSIGGVLEKATLDDLLVSGHGGVLGVYDVNLVLRLVRVFANGQGVSLQRMKKVGRLIDKYMAEISPDHNLKVSKFLAVAESLPDSARDCFDGVYRAIDIYIESHPRLSFEERSKLCRCLNYEKLTLEACKDLAKNPRIPPRISVQALVSQQSRVQPLSENSSPCTSYITSSPEVLGCDKSSEYSGEKDKMKLNLERMQYRVRELEKVCKDMKNQMSEMAKSNVISIASHNRPLPRLC